MTDILSTTMDKSKFKNGTSVNFRSRLGGSVSQLDARPTCGWRFDHEIFSTVILSFPLIQEGQLSVSGERMCTILVNRLED